MEPLYITGLNRFCIPGQEGTIEPILREGAVRDGIEKLALIRFGEHPDGMRKLELNQPDYNQVMNKGAAGVIALAEAVQIECSNGTVMAGKCILVGFKNSFFERFFLNTAFKQQITISLKEY